MAELGTLLIQLTLVIVAAKVAGELMERLGQPSVLGELLAGILLGPTLLSSILQPPGGAVLQFLNFENEVIVFLAEIGIILLLLEVGLESDVGEIKRVGKVAGGVALVGVVVPFMLGWLLFQYGSLAPLGEHRDLSALFLGATMTATSIGITARVLSDIKKLNTEEGKIVIGAAIFDDVIGLILLSMMISLALVGMISYIGVVTTIVLAIVFLVGSMVLGQILGPYLLRLVERMRVRGILIVTVVAVGLAMATMAEGIGLATILGSFAAGLIFARTERKVHIEERIKPIADIFVPVFFVLMGTRVDLRTLASGGGAIALLALSVTALAVVGKVVSGAAVPKKRARRGAVGVGMVPRGEVGIIFAGFGLSTIPQGHTTPIFTQETYSAVIVMVMVTTLLTPPLLRFAFREVKTQREPPTLAPIPGGQIDEYSAPASSQPGVEE